MSNPFLHKLILFFIVFGLSIHASGIDHIVFHNGLEKHFDKKSISFKKSSSSILFDLEDKEFELSNEEDEQDGDNSISFKIFYSNVPLPESGIANIDKLNFVYRSILTKVPLFIVFENYRL